MSFDDIEIYDFDKKKREISEKEIKLINLQKEKNAPVMKIFEYMSCVKNVRNFETENFKFQKTNTNTEFSTYIIYKKGKNIVDDVTYCRRFFFFNSKTSVKREYKTYEEIMTIKSSYYSVLGYESEILNEFLVKEALIEASKLIEKEMEEKEYTIDQQVAYTKDLSF